MESKASINIHVYCVGDGVIKPNQERLRPLQDYPPPTNVGSLRRVVGIFAYYAKWIPNFSDKIQPLVNATSFPLDESALSAFDLPKKELERATLKSINESQPFVVECDAPEVCDSATLNQCGRPVAFMSRTLQDSELHYPPVEKEATAIIEFVRKWRHFLAGRHFTLVTDQRSMTFMIDNRTRSKIKNNKIQSWRLEHASFSYTLKYRPCKHRTHSHVHSLLLCQHQALRDPQWVGSPRCNSNVTLCDVKEHAIFNRRCQENCSTCRTCAELKPVLSSNSWKLIKSTLPMERLGIDFKSLLPTTSRNAYILTVVDEYSRFPFAFPCPNMHSPTVIKCIDQIVTLCGMPSYIHSDRGT